MEIICTTPRLYLRRFTVEDAPLIFKLNTQPGVLKYLHERTLTSVEDAEAVIKEIILPQYTLYGLGRWAMIEKETGQFVGWCGLKLRPELDNEIDLGYRLHPKFWGQGLATEAAIACLRYGFDEKGLTCITARAHVENMASLNVLKKIGFQYVRNEIVDDCPVETYTLLYEDYLKKYPAQAY